MIVAGVLTPIEDVLTWVLEHLHTSLGLPWAWSVIGLTIIVRVLLVPVMVRQIHSMQRMQAHVPEMKAIQQKYKGDRQRLNEELMKFYKENNINPAASCLPIVLQFPIFIALYFVLRDFEKEVFPKYPSSDLSWLGFVPNITEGITHHWSGVVLLVVYIASQVSYGYFAALPTMPRSQRILMMGLPIIFLPFIIDPPGGTVFPVGLLMYWMTTNLWTVGQGIITRQMVPKPEPPPKRSSRTLPKEAPAPAVVEEQPKVAAQGGRPGPPRRVKRKKRKGGRR